MKMIALKRFHYPSGPSGQDYNAGDELEVLTDRDAKALRLLKVAKDPDTSPVDTAKTVEPRPLTRGTYRRVDMEVETKTETKTDPVVTKSE